MVQVPVKSSLAQEGRVNSSNDLVKTAINHDRYILEKIHFVDEIPDNIVQDSYKLQEYMRSMREHRLKELVETLMDEECGRQEVRHDLYKGVTELYTTFIIGDPK